MFNGDLNQVKNGLDESIELVICILSASLSLLL